MILTKQKIIDEIIIEIESGKSFTECVAVNGGKWRLAQRTFERRWSEANEQYKIIQDKRRAITESKTTQAHIESVESSLMSRNEKLKVLEDILNGTSSFEKIVIIQGQIERVLVTPDASDRMKAIEIHNKMQGDNAPDETKGEMQLVWKEEKTYETKH
jgi:phosphomevalonate kinase